MRNKRKPNRQLCTWSTYRMKLMHTPDSSSSQSRSTTIASIGRPSTMKQISGQVQETYDLATQGLSTPAWRSAHCTHLEFWLLVGWYLTYFPSRSERNVNILQSILARCLHQILKLTFGLIYCIQNSLTYSFTCTDDRRARSLCTGRKLRIKAHLGSAETCLSA